MNRTSLVTGSVLVGVVVGAALMLLTRVGELTSDFDCTKPKNHCIKVTVNPSTTPGGHKTLAVDVQDLYKKKLDKNHKIHWIIDTEGYTFADGAIAFTDAAGQAEFPSGACAVGTQGTVYHCEDVKGAEGNFKYIITISGADTLDPHIINN